MQLRYCMYARSRFPFSRPNMWLIGGRLGSHFNPSISFVSTNLKKSRVEHKLKSFSELWEFYIIFRLMCFLICSFSFMWFFFSFLTFAQSTLKPFWEFLQWVIVLYYSHTALWMLHCKASQHSGFKTKVTTSTKGHWRCILLDLLSLQIPWFLTFLCILYLSFLELVTLSVKFLWPLTNKIDISVWHFCTYFYALSVNIL